MQTRAWISRPHDGQIRLCLRHSRALFCTPATIIIQPIPTVRMAIITMWTSIVMSSLLPRVWVRLKEQLFAAPIGYVRVPLRGG